MFEDLNKNIPTPAGSINKAPVQPGVTPIRPRPAEPIDMFADTDKVAPKTMGVSAQPMQSPMPAGPAERAGLGKILMFAGIIIGTIIIVFVGFMIIDRLLTPSSEPVVTNYPVVEEESVQTENEEPATEEEIGIETAIEEATSTIAEADDDQDGLTNYDEENIYNTDPKSQDSDKDGLFDKEEIGIYKTDALNPDSDADGMSDGAEVKARRNPLGEGDLATLPNGVATPRENGAVIEETPAETEEEAGEEVVPALDSDGDGLFDDQEESYGTDKFLTDTDSDGLNDYEEIYTYDTDPIKEDTDGDTYLDGGEVENGYNPKGEGKL